MFPQLSVLTALLACNTLFTKYTPATGTGTTLTTPTTDDGGGGGGGGGGDDDDATAVGELAGDIEISKVSIYQGVEAVLYEDGDAPNTLEMPVITDRDGLLRVFVDPDNGFEKRKIKAKLKVVSNDGEDSFSEQMKVTDESQDDDLYTTFNFELDGELLKQTTEFEVELQEAEDDAPGGGTNKKATWASEDFGGLDTEATDTLRVKIIPIRYNADGSGRLPDTSATQLQRIEDLTMGIYPAQKVIVSADAPYDWDDPISPFSNSQWGNILNEMIYYRAYANEVPNTYYYGAFEPEASVYQFCSGGCILGLSPVAYSPDEYYFRASVGVGYTGSITSETLVHEMGHAHGRDHAPCGLYGQPSDPQYPYSGAKLGAWGYDVVGGTLKNPNTYVDMMSYCQPIWLSDYTDYALYARIQSVAEEPRAARVTRTTLVVGEDGVTTMGRPLDVADNSAAPRVDVQLFDEAGAPAGTTTAAFAPYDHIPGGIATLDAELPVGWTATVASPVLPGSDHLPK